jgi:hypothetical protein
VPLSELFGTAVPYRPGALEASHDAIASFRVALEAPLNLVLIGTALVNLDRVTVIDLDRDRRTGIESLKFHGDSKEPVIVFERVGREIFEALASSVPQHMRFNRAQEPEE